MSKKFLIVIILALLAINIYTLIHVQNSKDRNAIATQTEIDELHAYKVNFVTAIMNSNLSVRDISIKDSLGQVFLLNEIFKDRHLPLLVCRFSEQHCESCVDFAIRQFRQQIDSIGDNNILFLGMYKNNKIFNRTKPLYNIQNMDVYNSYYLNIPAEELGYPYYFVLHDDLTVSDVFVPDKSIPILSNNYLYMINKRYFNIEKKQ